jgi:DNA-binding NarL/FixJ family response regulator
MTVVKEHLGRSVLPDSTAGVSSRADRAGIDSILDDLAVPVQTPPGTSVEEIVGALNALCTRFETLADEARSIALLLARLDEGRAKPIDLPRLMANPVFRENPLSVSRREKEILSHLLSGKSNREISRELAISEKTVKNHLWKLYRKLGVKNRTQLFHYLIST